LRSFNEVVGYGVLARDEEVGRVDDFILDDDQWIIRMVVVNTGGPLSRKSVVFPSDCIGQISCPVRVVRVRVARATIEAAPEFDPSKPINREVETRFYDYYGRLAK
jgi:hypothetical protein